MKLLYIMDPMCSWCYGFQPELAQFLASNPSAEVDWILGGLAPDTKQPMDHSLRGTIAAYWYQIEKQTQVTFNHDFWALNTPYRSTYPACRAVIAAQTLLGRGAEKMVQAIQSAYYQQAQNPSLNDTLLACAQSIGLEEHVFSAALSSAEIEQTFQQHLLITQQLQVNGFPALFFITNDQHAYPLTLGFCQAAELEQRLTSIYEKGG